MQVIQGGVLAADPGAKGIEFTGDKRNL